MYSDIAGLWDTAGDFIDYVNCFMNKQVFNIAKKVKFIVPMTKAQTEDCRGQAIIQQIEVILNICSQSYQDLIKSVQPVITKVPYNPDDEDVNYDDDIDVIKANLKAIFDNYIDNYRKQRQEEINQREKAGHSADEEDGGIEDIEKLESEIEELQFFLNEFASKVVIYDPLDRQIPTEE